MSLVIRNARVRGQPQPVDIAIEGERISAIGPKLPTKAATEIDAAGNLVLPGLFNTWPSVAVGVSVEGAVAVTAEGGVVVCVSTSEPVGCLFASRTGVFARVICGRAICNVARN